jgi:hypothetical protein
LVLGGATAGAAFTAISIASEVLISANATDQSRRALTMLDLIHAAVGVDDLRLRTFDGYDPSRRCIGPFSLAGACIAALADRVPGAALVDPWLPARDGDLVVVRSHVTGAAPLMAKRLRWFGRNWVLAMDDGTPPIPLGPEHSILGRVVAAFSLAADSAIGRYQQARTAELVAKHEADLAACPAVGAALAAVFELGDTSCVPSGREYSRKMPGKLGWQFLEEEFSTVLPGPFLEVLQGAQRAVATDTVDSLSPLTASALAGAWTLPGVLAETATITLPA